MNSRSREGFYTLWTAAIVLCVVLALFSVIFASFLKADPASSADEPTWETEEDAVLSQQDAAAEDPLVYEEAETGSGSDK